MSNRWALCALAALSVPIRVYGQAIEFESNGLKFQTLTRGGVTVMFTHLPGAVREYSVLQVVISNGSSLSWTVKPEDFLYRRKDGPAIEATAPGRVVEGLLDRAGRNDAIRLVTNYEAGIYGMNRLKASTGYEQRRQQALTELTSPRLKAAAAASAVIFVRTKLAPGKSTDGAIFYSNDGKPLGPGTLTVRVAGETFEFDSPGNLGDHHSGAATPGSHQ